MGGRREDGTGPLQGDRGCCGTGLPAQLTAQRGAALRAHHFHPQMGKLRLRSAGPHSLRQSWYPGPGPLPGRGLPGVGRPRPQSRGQLKTSVSGTWSAEGLDCTTQGRPSPRGWAEPLWMTECNSILAPSGQGSVPGLMCPGCWLGPRAPTCSCSSLQAGVKQESSILLSCKRPGGQLEALALPAQGDPAPGGRNAQVDKEGL